VFTPQRVLLRTLPQALALFFGCIALPAFGAPAHPQPPASTPPPSSAGIFPLAGVHAGLRGTAWSVFQGAVPESFGVDVLGVLRNAEGPGEDLILARLTGANVEYTGVVAGMSGSPVYIDGKLVGAIAYRIGSFSKEAIAGITPIAEMLAVRDMDGGGATGTRLTPAATDPHAEIRPIDTPLVFSGFSPEALNLWKRHAPALGMQPEAGLGGSGETQTTAGPREKANPEPPLEPGSAVSALLVSGDMEIAATCTVTYLDAKHLLACGHPLMQTGPVSLPMTKADVVATLASPAGSFKIVNTGRTVGAFSEDRQTAIGGTLGAKARMIPMTIMITGDRPAKTIRLGILDDPQLTGTAVLVSLYQALQESPGYAQEDSYRVQATLRVSGYPSVDVRTLASPGGLGGSALSAALLVGQRFDSLYSNGERKAQIEGIDVHVDAVAGHRSAELVRGAVEQSVVHAGDHITIAATVVPYRGKAMSLQIPVTLPTSLGRGEVRLLLSDGPTLDQLKTAPASADTPLGSTVAYLNSLHPDDRLYVTLLAPDAEISVDGATLGDVPPSMLNMLAEGHARDRSTLHSESATTLGSIPVQASLSGEQVLTLRVE
jgi:hypothetical protein